MNCRRVPVQIGPVVELLGTLSTFEVSDLLMNGLSVPLQIGVGAEHLGAAFARVVLSGAKYHETFMQ